MMATATYVQGAERMLTRVELTASGIWVRFADDQAGEIPLAGLKLKEELRRVKLPNPYVIELHLEGGQVKEIPWDYARHYADANYRRRSEEASMRGRKHLGERLQRFRREAGLSQEELAKKSGVGRVTIVRIESGDQSPRYETLVALSKGLNVPIARLLLD